MQASGIMSCWSWSGRSEGEFFRNRSQNFGHYLKIWLGLDLEPLERRFGVVNIFCFQRSGWGLYRTFFEPQGSKRRLCCLLLLTVYTLFYAAAGVTMLKSCMSSPNAASLFLGRQILAWILQRDGLQRANERLSPKQKDLRTARGAG